VTVLAIDKVGPRPYHFRSGPSRPTSSHTTRPGSQKSKISVVHSLAVLKGHPECFKCGKTLWRAGLRLGLRWGSLQRSSRPLSWWGWGWLSTPEAVRLSVTGRHWVKTAQAIGSRNLHRRIAQGVKDSKFSGYKIDKEIRKGSPRRR